MSNVLQKQEQALFFRSRSSSVLLLGLNLQRRSEQESSSGCSCPPYLNKYLSEAAALSVFSHGGGWDIMDKGEDGL